MMVLYLWQHSYPAQAGIHFGLFENCLKCLPGERKQEARILHPSQTLWTVMMAPFFLLPLPDSSSSSPGSLHCFNKNMILKIAALRLDLPGAPTPTELADKLFPCRGKLSPAEMMPGQLQCPEASPQGSARVTESEPWGRGDCTGSAGPEGLG